MASFPEEIPGDDLIRAFTLTGADRDLVAIRRGAANRLGLALQLCALRYLGFVPRNLSAAPRLAACFVADQLEVSPDEIQSYARRGSRRADSTSPRFGNTSASRCSSAERRGRGSAEGIGSEQDPTRQLGRTPPGGRIAPDFEAPDWRTGENVLSRALRDLGRLVKTQFILRWIENPDYRRRIHRQRNKGEALHALRRFLFFAHEGKVQRRQADQQTNQVLCLNLVTNAIVTWNTVYMNAAIERLRAEGRIDRDIDLGHLSPALYGHVNP